MISYYVSLSEMQGSRSLYCYNELNIIGFYLRSSLLYFTIKIKSIISQRHNFLKPKYVAKTLLISK